MFRGEALFSFALHCLCPLIGLIVWSYISSLFNVAKFVILLILIVGCVCSSLWSCFMSLLFLFGGFPWTRTKATFRPCITLDTSRFLVFCLLVVCVRLLFLYSMVFYLDSAPSCILCLTSGNISLLQWCYSFHNLHVFCFGGSSFVYTRTCSAA